MSQFRFPMPSQDRVVIIVSLLVVIGMLGVGGLRFDQILAASGTTFERMLQTSAPFAAAVCAMAGLVVVWIVYTAGTLVQSGRTTLTVGTDFIEYVRPRLIGLPGTGDSIRVPIDPALVAKVKLQQRRLRRGWWLHVSHHLDEFHVCIDLAVADQSGENSSPPTSASEVRAHALIRAIEASGATNVKVE
jgi:hypothetical protein